MASACAAKSPETAAAAGARPRNRDLITQEDLAADASLRAQTVLEVIRTLRPQFLNDRGNNTMTAQGDPEAGLVHASIDNGRVVPISELNGMHGNEITEIRYLNAAQALQKFGPASRQGPVILVITVVK
ncbi:MAG: hypothetical protein ABIT20_09310 [Gemmatimonadaceae bacterium]